MRKGLRFQTKLTLAMIAAIAVVTFAILSVTESKVKQTFEHQFARYFENQVARIEESNSRRTQEFIELCEKLAKTDLVVETLRGNPDEASKEEFRRIYSETLKELEGRPIESPLTRKGHTPLSGDLINKLGSVAVMNLSGEVTSLSLFPSLQTTNRRALAAKKKIHMQRRITRDDLRKFAKTDTQQTLYLPSTTGDGNQFVQEMVSTPVIDPDTGEPLGLFLRATPAETEEQRLLERYYEEFNAEAAPIGGILLENRVYSRTLDQEFADSLSLAISEEFDSDVRSQTATNFEKEIEGTPYRIYIAPLSSEAVFNSAFQVTAFPLTRLQDAVAELRIQGSGIGLFGLFIGFLIASFFSRKLSVPLHDLARGTEEIQKGNLDHRVEVKSNDEIGELAASFNEMAEELKLKANYRELLGKVSDESVAQAMIEGELDLELGGELKYVSILFCDIRGFTSMTEEMHPGAVIDMLNDHMTAMTAIVRKHFGVVDKFVGDEIMAVFGGLKSYGNDAANAAACALDMIAERERLNRELEHPVEIGVGVATGEVVAGCMGSNDRLNYTVLGSRVNLAARLCGQASAMEAIADRATVEASEDTLESEAIPNLLLKGISREVTAFRITPLNSSVISDRSRTTV